LALYSNKKSFGADGYSEFPDNSAIPEPVIDCIYLIFFNSFISRPIFFCFLGILLHFSGIFLNVGT